MNLNFSTKNAEYKSWAGSLTSCLIYAVTLLLVVQNTIILHARDGSSFTSAEKVKFNDENRIFGQDDGFQIAIALLDENTADLKDL